MTDKIDKSKSSTRNRELRKNKMKQIFNSGNYSQKANLAFLILRIVIGSVMLTHGLGKLSMLFSSNPVQFPDPVGIGATASLAFTVFAEVVCSFLLIFGIATRLAGKIGRNWFVVGAIVIIVAVITAYILL